MTTRIRIVINCEVQEGQRWFIFVVELKDLPQLLYVVCVSDKPCMIQQQKEDRVRPKFGFGYGAKTDLTYGFGLVSATAKVQWHKFGFGLNITPQRRIRRNCKIGANCNTVAV